MDPPSGELARTLATLGLADASVWRRCRGTVKRFSRGLPTYDSIWIDALVRQKVLTPFQARQLEQRRSHELLIGEQVVLRAQRHFDPQFALFEAQELGTNRALFVAKAQALSGTGEAAALRLQRLIATLQGLKPLVPDSPVSFLRGGDSFAVVSPWKGGESLARFLVRRGRFPEEIVRGLAREMVRQLAAGEVAGPHGDLRLSNVWLTSQGDVVLWNRGVLPALIPEITIHTPLPLDAYDGLAPERIDSHQPPSLAADLYALGCLWWQLLTGRPPYTLADPLAKLTAHRTRRIADVRTLSPETSESFAKLLTQLTAPNPQDRPASYLEVQRQLESKAVSGRGRVRQFVQSFESAAPRRPAVAQPTHSRGVAATLAAGLLITASLVAWNRDKLSLPGIPRASAAIESSPAPATVPPEQSIRTAELPPAAPPSKWKPLPQPSSDGTVVLEAGGLYAAGELTGGTRLHLRSEGNTPAVIMVGEDPLELTADLVLLENVLIRSEESTGTLLLAAQELSLQRVQLGSNAPPGSADSPSSIQVEWAARTVGDPRAGGILVLNSIIAPGSSLRCHLPLRSALLQNVLKVGAGPLFELTAGVPAGLRVTLQMNHCTLRESGPLIKLPPADVLAQSGRLTIAGGATVIDLAAGTPLFELDNADSPGPWESHVELATEGFLVRPQLVLAGEWVPAAQAWLEVDAPRLTAEGLLSGEFHFAEPAPHTVIGHQTVVDALPVQLWDRAPGIDPQLLPAEARSEAP